MFISSSERILYEQANRDKVDGRLLSFGVKFLDDAMYGIMPNDLVLIGAPTGIGKTELCVQIALANLENGKRVHFIALEAEPFEIERRLMFPMIADAYWLDKDRPHFKNKLNMTAWILGRYGNEIKKYEEPVLDVFKNAFHNMFTFYKHDKFGIDELIKNVMDVHENTDLIIIDHIHYFDWDDENDNRAIKNITKTVRDIAIEIGRPIILVAHLRKRDRAAKELCPGADEFHGSSELTKIATKIITIASAGTISDGMYETYFRIAKNRVDGSVTRFLGKIGFDYKRRKYCSTYQIGFSNAEKFDEILEYPDWGRDSRQIPKPKPTPSYEKRIPHYQQESFGDD